MQKFLQRVYHDFRNEQDYWCELPLSQFVHNTLSDKIYRRYDKKHFEQFYLLKYAPLYVEEYAEAYAHFLSRYNKGTLRVLSVGVGAGLDYYGLDLALRNHTQTKVEYLGIDLVNWHYRDNAIGFEQIDLKYIASNPKILEFIKGGVDLIIFPKSIVEIPVSTYKDNAFMQLCDVLIENNVDDVWFINSYIKTSNKISGMDAFKLVLDNMGEAGYGINDGLDASHYYSSTGSRAEYPMDYRGTWQRDLREYCQKKCNCQQVERCNLIQHPMLNKQYIAYSITNLKKVA